MATVVWPLAALLCLTMKDMLIHANSWIRKFEMLRPWRGRQKQKCGYMDAVCASLPEQKVFSRKGEIFSIFQREFKKCNFREPLNATQTLQRHREALRGQSLPACRSLDNTVWKVLTSCWINEAKKLHYDKINKCSFLIWGHEIQL